MNASTPCSRRAAEWRAQAQHVREHATLPSLTEAQRAALIASADLCDLSAAAWQNAADTEETAP